MLNPSVPVYLEFHDQTSHKFYEVTVIESTVTIRYGRVGTAGQTLSDDYPSPEKAQAAAEKKLKEKQKKGYRPANAPAPEPIDLSAPLAVIDATPDPTATPDSIRTILADIDATTPPGMAVTLATGETWSWRTPRIRPDCLLLIRAVADADAYSLNLMAQADIAYHFNPRRHEAQVVQNTREREIWGPEERFPLPSELIEGREFELAIAVQPTELVIYLNGQLLYRYRHRIAPLLIDGLHLGCNSGDLEVRSIKLSNRNLSQVIPEPVSPPEPAVEPPSTVIEIKPLSAELEALLSYFEPGAVRRYPPATEEMIAHAEQQLGTPFPPSLRSLLQVTNGLDVFDWINLLGVPAVGGNPDNTIVDWSLAYREDGPSDLIVLIQDGSGDPFCLLGDQRNERGECAVTKVNHETREPRGVIASSLDRLLWFELRSLQGYLHPNGEARDEEELEEEEYDEEWTWYDDPEYCLQHDPDIATFG